MNACSLTCLHVLQQQGPANVKVQPSIEWINQFFLSRECNISAGTFVRAVSGGTLRRDLQSINEINLQTHRVACNIRHQPSWWTGEALQASLNSWLRLTPESGKTSGTAPANIPARRQLSKNLAENAHRNVPGMSPSWQTCVEHYLKGQG